VPKALGSEQRDWNFQELSCDGPGLATVWRCFFCSVFQDLRKTMVLIEDVDDEPEAGWD